MFLGVDIGGTSVKMGLLDDKGGIHARYEASVSDDGYRTPILDAVCRHAQSFVRQYGRKIEGIGVSATGQIDTHTGTVIGTNGKIPKYEGAPIAKEMRACFGVPCAVLNDANAAALGECVAGAARGLQDVVMVTLGTGVGGGIVIGGKIYGGTRGIAGELGHFTLYGDGVPCACGRRGCYESYASTSALVSAAERATGQRNLDGRIIFSRVEQGDDRLYEVLTAWISDIAAGITGLVHIFNPQMVVIGGGVCAQEKLLMQPLRARVLDGVMPRFAENLRVERARLGNDAGMIGAVAFFLDGQANG